MKPKKIVVMGGGTGTFTVLLGLKQYPVRLTAIVSMADDGGSTGTLRDELGVLPPGDVRQCLVALSTSDKLMRELMMYRFSEGNLKGHNFGNLLLSTLEKVTGSFDAAVEKASEILRLDGRVVPVTLDNVKLIATLENGKTIRGEAVIDKSDLTNLKTIALEPAAKANPKAITAIKEADAIVIGPGDLYTGLIPNLLVRGIPEAIRKSRATKIYVSNLMNRHGQTDGYTVRDLAERVQTYLGGAFDYVVFNNRTLSPSMVERYEQSGGHPVSIKIPSEKSGRSKTVYVGTSLVDSKIHKAKAGDALARSFIRHNPKKLAEAIVGLIGE